MARKTLKDAKALIKNKEHWCKEDLAQDKEGRSVDVCDEDAHSWCILGAVTKVFNYSYEYESAISALKSQLPPDYKSIDEYNDHFMTTHQDILDLFDDAIEAGE